MSVQQETKCQQLKDDLKSLQKIIKNDQLALQDLEKKHLDAVQKETKGQKKIKEMQVKIYSLEMACLKPVPIFLELKL